MNFPKKIEIVYEEDKKQQIFSNSIIFQKELGNTLHQVKGIKEYFRNMQSQIWISPEFRNDSYAIVVKDDTMNELLFFKLEFSYKSSSPYSSLSQKIKDFNEYSLNSITNYKEKLKENDSKKISKR
jgi:hypothetical protein